MAKMTHKQAFDDNQTIFTRHGFMLDDGTESPCE